MSGTVYQAAAGALLQQMRLDVLSNNLANVNTSGFKADKPVFRMDTGDEKNNTTPTTVPGRLSPYAPPLEAVTDYSAAPLVKTGNPLDAAIIGKGFFQVQAPEGERFTRSGHFMVNEDGVLSTAEGWPVMGQSAEINIEGSRVEISDQGEVMVDGELVDTLRVVDFGDTSKLHKVGDTFFSADPGSDGQTLDDSFEIAQGFVEGSNVDAVRTMTEMIETIRVFEAYQKIIRSADDTTAKTVSEVGRID